MCRLVAVVFLSTLLAVFGFQFQSLTKPRLFSRHRATLGMNVDGLKIDLRGKTIFVAGVADSTGYGWAIAKACAEAGARILLGTWPPVMPLFTMNLERGQYDHDMVLSDGSKMTIAKIYPLDASFDDAEAVPESVSQSKRYRAFDKFSISEVAEKVKADFGRVDGVVHALANGPEVAKPLLQTSRAGYLSAVSSSAFSLVSIARHFVPLMTDGGAFVSLSYLAAERAVAGYGGGMSSAKAALESDTRTLAYELGRLAEYSGGEATDAALTKRPLRINCISAGPLASRAAKAIGGPTAGAAMVDSRTFIEKAIDYSENNAPLRRRLVSDDVGSVAAFLLSDLSSGVTGCTLHVDNGLANMGLALDSVSLLPPTQL